MNLICPICGQRPEVTHSLCQTYNTLKINSEGKRGLIVRHRKCGCGVVKTIEELDLVKKIYDLGQGKSAQAAEEL